MTNKFTLDSLEIFWLGHASFKIKKTNLIIYIDPYQIKKPEPVDLILITHDHYDHCDQKSIKKITNNKTAIVGPVKVSQKLADNVRVISAGEETKIKGVKIRAVPAYNQGKPFHPPGEGIGFVIGIDGKNIYHAGDTDKIPEMDQLKDIDLALLPVGGTYTMDIVEAVEAVKLIKPKTVIPMHYGTLSETRVNSNKFKELIGDLSQVEILSPEV